jgi:hypothetical protein
MERTEVWGAGDIEELLAILRRDEMEVLQMDAPSTYPSQLPLLLLGHPLCLSRSKLDEVQLALNGVGIEDDLIQLVQFHEACADKGGREGE